jgi:hypothetical protein
MSIDFKGAFAVASTLKIADNATLTYPNADFTVGAVLIMNGTFTSSPQYIVSSGGFQSAGSLSLVLLGGAPATLGAYIDTAGGPNASVTFNPQIEANKAYLCILQRKDNALVCKYCPVLTTAPTDGSAVKTSTSSFAITTALDGPGNSGYFVIGDRNGDRRMDEAMERVFRVDRALTDFEIAKLAYGMQLADLGYTPAWYLRMSNGSDYQDRGPSAMTVIANTTTLPDGPSAGYGYVAPTDTPVAITQAPVINGTPQVGVSTSFTAATVTGTPTPTVTTQWLLDDVAISGATSSTYTPVTGDAGKTLKVRQTATNTTSGTVNTVSSSSAGVVVTAAVNAAPPTISGTPTLAATPQVGTPLAYTPASVTGTAPITSTQQWVLDGTDIAGATSATYTPVSGDVGKTLAVRQIATNGQGTASATSAGGVVANVAPTVTVVPPVNERIFQRANGSANVPLSGTYTGTKPAKIEAQLTYSDSTVAKAWFDVSATINNDGTWTATPSIPQGSKKYRIAVRSKDGASTVLSTSAVDSNRWGVGDIIAFLGSSSAGAWMGQAWEYPGGPNNEITSYVNEGGWSVIAAYKTPASMMMEYIAGKTGVVTAALPRGVGGTTYGNWLNSGDDVWVKLVASVANAGNALAGAFISLGSNDTAGTIVTSKTVHLDRIKLLISNLRTLAGNNTTLPVLISGMNRRTAYSTTEQTAEQFSQRCEWVHTAESEAGDLPNVYHVQNLDFTIGGDGIHLDTAGIYGSTERIRYVWGEIAASGVYQRGPKITSLVVNGSTVVATIAHRGTSTDFTPTSSITGFVVSDTTGTASVVSAVRTDATHITLTCDRALGSSVVVKYLPGNAPDIGTPVYGNGATPLPMVAENELVTASASATVSGVTVSPTTATGSTTFTATVTGTNSPPQSVTWSATGGTITSGGVFTAPAATGSTQTITVTATSTFDTSKSGTATVTIAAAVPIVSSVTVSPSTATGSTTFTATVNGTNSPSQSVTWSTTAGSVTSGGVFTAPAATTSAQTITVTATSVADSTKSGTATVTIAALVPTVTSVSVSPTSATVNGGATQQFSATVTGTNSPSQSVTWTTTAGTINSSGLFTAPAATTSIQTVTVRATSVQDSTKSNTSTVTVPAAVATVSSVSVSPSTATVVGGATQQFAATVVGTNSPSQSVTWTASAGSVSSSGLFTAPAATSSSQTITVTATSTADTSKSGVATVTTPAATPATASFTPSAARTVAVQAIAPVFTGGKFWNLNDPKKPHGSKDPNSTIDITFDWSAWLADMGSPAIASVTFTLSGVDDAGSYATGNKTTVFVSGGTGSQATVTCKITTASTPARVDERTVYLDMEQQ